MFLAKSKNVYTCIRHVDSDLNVHEDFIGLYELPDTRGEAIANMVQDVFTRILLPISHLGGQTYVYDGAANMNGPYNGCQAKIRECQPLAVYFQCGSHMPNLIVQQCVAECPLVCGAIQWVHDLGVIFNRSGKSSS